MNNRSLTIVAVVACWLLHAGAPAARADIKNWMTGQTIPGTEGIVAEENRILQNWNTPGHNLQYADFSGGLDLSGARFDGSWLDSALFTGAGLSNAIFGGVVLSNPARLTNADLSGADLTSASMHGVTLVGANLANALVPYANFGFTGLTEQQLYSTASYKNRVLTGVGFEQTDMSGWNFRDQSLQHATFLYMTLTDANFHGADLSGTGFVQTFLGGADFTNAIVNHAYLPFATLYGLMPQQLYSTNSYKRHDLSGIHLGGNDLSGWDLSQKNLVNANLYGGKLANTDLSFSDLRSASFGYEGAAPITRNTILPYSSLVLGFPSGFIEPLALGSGERLVIRDFAYGVAVLQGMTLASGSVLEMRFFDSVWGSTIAVMPLMVPDLGGTLDLRFADGVDPAALVGTKFHLFDWNGQLVPGDHFDEISSLPGFEWDTSELYTTGDVTLMAVPEPSAVVLAAVALVVVCMLRRRHV